MIRAFLPSQVQLGIPPLVDTMKRAEREFAAALLVRACQVAGDEWKTVEPKALGEVIAADIAAGIDPIRSLSTKGFV